MSATGGNPAALASAGLRSARTPRTLQRKTAGCERRPGGRTSTFIVHSKVWRGRLWQPECVNSLTAGCGWVDRYAGFCVPAPLPTRSGDHPSTNAVADALQRPTRTLGRAALNRALSGLAPGGVYLAFPVTREAGGLLHHRFTLTCLPPVLAQADAGGLFSVALACGLPRVGVTHHPALRSPDVPRATYVARGRLVNPSALQSTGVGRYAFSAGTAGLYRRDRWRPTTAHYG